MHLVPTDSPNGNGLIFVSKSWQFSLEDINNKTRHHIALLQNLHSFSRGKKVVVMGRKLENGNFKLRMQSLRMVMVISTLQILPSRLMMTLGMVQVLSLNFNDRLFSMVMVTST